MSFFGNLAKLLAIGAFFVATGPFGLAVSATMATALRIGGMVLGYLGAAIDRPKTAQNRQVYGMTGDPGAPLPVVYGRAKVGSIAADWFIDPVDQGSILYMPVALCHGSRDGFGIEKIEEIWLDGRRAVVNPTSGELAESGGNDVREHPYGLVALDYKLFLGTSIQNVGSTDLSGLFPDANTSSPSDVTDSGWSATTDTGKGIACISFRFSNTLAYKVAGGGTTKEKQPIYNGPPSAAAIVLGNFVEDPRSAINVTGQPVTSVNVTFANVGAADTITIAAGALFSNTWQVGDRIVVSGSASNNGTYTVAVVAASVITVSATDSLVNEGPVGGVTLKRWAAPSNGGDNAALCIRDYLLSTVYGCGYDASLIHEASFRDCADFCDVLIDYPLTAAVEQSVRFTCNGVVDTGRPTKSNLDELLSSCRGSLVWEQGQFKLAIRGMLNLVDNPDFETDIEGMTALSATLIHSTAQAHAGTGALKVTTTNVTGSGVRVALRRMPTEPYDNSFPLVGGRPYTLRVWVYAPAGSVGKILKTTVSAVDTTLVLGWQEIVATATSADAVMAELSISTASAQGVFDFWVDEVRFGPDPVLALTPSNIIGQWSFRNAGSEERWNLAKASYVDPLNGEYKATETQWPPIGSNSYLTADNNFLNRLDIALPFTNDQPMAQAIAQVTLNEARNGIACQVLATEEALIASVGDRVTVTHPTPGWTAKQFWVTGMELRPDTTVGLSLMEYQPTAYDLATMEDRRAYPATDHATPDTIGDDTIVGYSRFTPTTPTLTWTYLDGYAYPTTNGVTSGGHAHLAPILLPQGARITAFDARYYLGDASAGTSAFAWGLIRAPLDGTTPEILASQNDNVETNAWQTGTITLDHVVDWTLNRYYASVGLQATGTLLNARFMSVSVIWE